MRTMWPGSKSSGKDRQCCCMACRGMQTIGSISIKDRTLFFLCSLPTLDMKSGFVTTKAFLITPVTKPLSHQKTEITGTTTGKRWRTKTFLLWQARPISSRSHLNERLKRKRLLLLAFRVQQPKCFMRWHSMRIKFRTSSIAQFTQHQLHGLIFQVHHSQRKRCNKSKIYIPHLSAEITGLSDASPYVIYLTMRYYALIHSCRKVQMQSYLSKNGNYYSSNQKQRDSRKKSKELSTRLLDNRASWQMFLTLN